MSTKQFDIMTYTGREDAAYVDIPGVNVEVGVKSPAEHVSVCLNKEDDNSTQPNVIFERQNDRWLITIAKHRDEDNDIHIYIPDDEEGIIVEAMQVLLENSVDAN